MLECASPLRFKARGHYTSAFTPEDFAFCLHRRTLTLCSQYGGISTGTEDYRFSGGWELAGSGLAWRDLPHYSARQKEAMRLGGVSGSMVLSGTFSPYEYALLRFAEIFHAGKNTNFGLGRLILWEKKGYTERNFP